MGGVGQLSRCRRRTEGRGSQGVQRCGGLVVVVIVDGGTTEGTLLRRRVRYRHKGLSGGRHRRPRAAETVAYILGQDLATDGQTGKLHVLHDDGQLSLRSSCCSREMMMLIEKKAGQPHLGQIEQSDLRSRCGRHERRSDDLQAWGRPLSPEMSVTAEELITTRPYLDTAGFDRRPCQIRHHGKRVRACARTRIICEQQR